MPFYCLTTLSEDFKASIHLIPGRYSLSGSGNLPLLFGYVVKNRTEYSRGHTSPSSTREYCCGFYLFSSCLGQLLRYQLSCSNNNKVISSEIYDLGALLESISFGTSSRVCTHYCAFKQGTVGVLQYVLSLLVKHKLKNLLSVLRYRLPRFRGKGQNLFRFVVHSEARTRLDNLTKIQSKCMDFFMKCANVEFSVVSRAGAGC